MIATAHEDHDVFGSARVGARRSDSERVGTLRGKLATSGLKQIRRDTSANEHDRYVMKNGRLYERKTLQRYGRASGIRRPGGGSGASAAEGSGDT